MADIAALTQLIEPEAHALGLALVRVRMFGGAGDATLQVMAERPDTRQLAIDECAALSRRISDRLDEAEAGGCDPIAHAYRLEVSSPGIDRPADAAPGLRRLAGHEARITLAEKLDGRKQLTGVLLGVDGDQVTIDVAKYQPVTLPFGRIADAKLLLTDALIAATAPLSTEGAEEIIEVEG
ncbi:MAG: ribosome maturation protein RimP [Sphingomonas sp.]